MLPRNITVPRRDEATDETESNTTKKKKKKKNIASTGKELTKKKKSANVGNIPAAPVGAQIGSSQGLRIPDKIRTVLDPDALELAKWRERFENEGINDDGSFDAFGTIFPPDATNDPKDRLGGNSHTTGQGDYQEHPGHSLDDIAAGFAGQGSGDGRREDGGSGSGDTHGPLHGDGERGDDVGQRGVGAFGSGLPDPSGQVSQRRGSGRTASGRVDRTGGGGRIVTEWFTDSRGTTTTTYHEDRRGRPLGSWATDTKDEEGSATTVYGRDGTNITTYNPSSAQGPNRETHYRERSYDEDNNQHDLYYGEGDSEGYEVVTDSEGNVIRRGPVPLDSQPSEGSTSGGDRERGHVGFYNVTCSATSCTYTPLSMEQIMADMGMQINPGGMERPPEDINTGPRVTPSAATDPHPDDVMYGRSGRQRPIGQGCAGMVRC